MPTEKAKVFVIGDIHGAYKALLQCFERSSFDYNKDRLIVLGDVCDGYPEVKQCINELLKIKHCDYIIGNHDLWALDWATKGVEEELWLTQGGRETKASYGGGNMPQAHINFLKNAHLWIELDNKLFVHAGIDPNKEVEKHGLNYLTWDRNLVESAWKKAHQKLNFKFSTYDEIFVGHTTTQWFARNKETKDLTPAEIAELGIKPLFLCNVIILDTGAGWSGKLTIMDVNTHEYWQSDFTPQLYGMEGRK